jgi:hypothetical protein
MPVCQAQNAMGWMLANWPLYQERCTATFGVQLQHQGRMCVMIVRSFAVAQIGIWREYVAVFKLTLTDNCVVFLRVGFKVLHDHWSLEVAYVDGFEFCELNAAGSILYVSLCVYVGRQLLLSLDTMEASSPILIGWAVGWGEGFLFLFIDTWSRWMLQVTLTPEP